MWQFTEWSGWGGSEQSGEGTLQDLELASPGEVNLTVRQTASAAGETAGTRGFCFLGYRNDSALDLQRAGSRPGHFKQCRLLSGPGIRSHGHWMKRSGIWLKATSTFLLDCFTLRGLPRKNRNKAAGRIWRCEYWSECRVQLGCSRKQTVPSVLKPIIFPLSLR